MARPSLEDRIAAISALRSDPSAPESLKALDKALGMQTASVVAEAASVVAEAGIDSRLPKVASAFERFVEGGVKKDPRCRAKIAIIRALHDGAWMEDEPLLAASRTEQFEPNWGGAEDTAGELRALAATALVQARYDRVFDELVRLLLDPLRVVRASAARALGNTGRPEAVPLLRYKILSGDSEGEVVTECLGSLLHLDAGSFDFVVGFLDNRDEAVAEAAAMALGQSRLPSAMDVLVRWSETRIGDDRRVAFVALALLRLPSAFDHLLGVVGKAPEVEAANALDALAIYAHDPALVDRARQAVSGRDSEVLRQKLASRFSEI